MKSTLFLLVCIALASCRTNDIARYPLVNESVLYRNTVAADAAHSSVHITNPVSNEATHVFTAIGADIVGNEVQARLDKAVNPDSLSTSLTMGVQDMMQTYFNTRTVASTTDKPTYIVETALSKYELHSNSSGVYAQVCGATKIFQAGTARLVWEDDESISIPLRSSGAGWMDGPAGTAVSIINISEIMKMSDEELRTVLDRAAEEAGRKIGEQLRKDVAGK